MLGHLADMLLRSLTRGCALLCALAYCFLPTASEGAPVQWIGNGHFYDAVLSPGIGWTDALGACYARGGYLATLTGDQENEFVKTLVANNSAFWVHDCCNDLGPWVGASQHSNSAEPSGGWTWWTGEPWVFTDWRAGQPDNCCGGQEKLRFIRTDGSSPIGWDDCETFNPSSHRKGYVAELPCPPLPISRLSQGGQESWAHSSVGMSSCSSHECHFHTIGCAVTALTMALVQLGYAVTPQVLNDYGKNNGGFDTDANIVFEASRWVKGVSVNPYAQVRYRTLAFSAFSQAAFFDSVERALCFGQPVILRVPGSDASKDHFVVASGTIGVGPSRTFVIKDPGYSDRINLRDAYGDAPRQALIFWRAGPTSSPTIAAFQAGTTDLSGLRIRAYSGFVLLRDAQGRLSGWSATGAAIQQIPGTVLDMSGGIASDDAAVGTSAGTRAYCDISISPASNGSFGIVASGTPGNSVDLAITGFNTIGRPALATAHSLQLPAGGQDSVALAWDATVTVQDPALPSRPQLLTSLSVHPNPMSRRTIIAFTLSERVRVEVEVYDTRGRRVAVLSSDELAAGAHSIGWNGRDSSGGLVSSGVYFIRATAGGESQNVRVTWLR